MGWTRKMGQTHRRKHQNNQNYSECAYNLIRDKLGNTKLDNRANIGNCNGYSNKWAKQQTNGQQRQANKDAIKYELEDYEGWQQELAEEYKKENWEDFCYDDELDFPVTWEEIDFLLTWEDVYGPENEEYQMTRRHKSYQW